MHTTSWKRSWLFPHYENQLALALILFMSCVFHHNRISFAIWLNAFVTFIFKLIGIDDENQNNVAANHVSLILSIFIMCSAFFFSFFLTHTHRHTISRVARILSYEIIRFSLVNFPFIWLTNNHNISFYEDFVRLFVCLFIYFIYLLIQFLFDFYECFMI